MNLGRRPLQGFLTDRSDTHVGKHFIGTVRLRNDRIDLRVPMTLPRIRQTASTFVGEPAFTASSHLDRSQLVGRNVDRLRHHALCRLALRSRTNRNRRTFRIRLREVDHVIPD